jgi:hypothetical protein
LIAQFAFKSDRHEPWPVKSKTLNPNWIWPFLIARFMQQDRNRDTRFKFRRISKKSFRLNSNENLDFCCIRRIIWFHYFLL